MRRDEDGPTNSRIGAYLAKHDIQLVAGAKLVLWRRENCRFDVSDLRPR
jgi:hypothetical protein